MMVTPRNQLHTVPARAFLLALVLVYLLAQTLGWVHRGLHGSGTSFPDAAGHTWLEAGAHQEAQAATGELFGSHTQASDCRLFDGIGQGGCAPAVVLHLPGVPPASFIAGSPAEFAVRWTALFQARAPPSSR